MDPNTALANLLSASATLQRLEDLDIAPGDDVDHDAQIADAARTAADSAAALDGWLRGGGFLPDAWSANRPRPLTTGRMYAVHATYSREIGPGEQRTGQVPTFYLHPDVQGILTEEGAARVATDLLRRGTEPSDGITYHVHAVEV
jgi:hypothetical protein